MMTNSKAEKYYLKGDITEVIAAKDAAKKIGITVIAEGGTYFVNSTKEFAELKAHLIKNNIFGWWNYLTTKEYLEVMAG